MYRLLTLPLLVSLSFATTIDDDAIYRGSRIAKTLCNVNKLPKNSIDRDDAYRRLKHSKACRNLSSKNLMLVAAYLAPKVEAEDLSIEVPKGAKCPVCGMFVSKYPKWAAVMVVDKKQHFFDGVKDMFKYYFFDGDFKYNRANISKLKVTNYYTLKSIDAKSALFVYDSKVLGPMGRELIAFSTQDEAFSFMADHGGKLMLFKDITAKKVMALDGVELKSDNKTLDANSTIKVKKDKNSTFKKLSNKDINRLLHKLKLENNSSISTKDIKLEDINKSTK